MAVSDAAVGVWSKLQQGDAKLAYLDTLPVFTKEFHVALTLLFPDLVALQLACRILLEDQNSIFYVGINDQVRTNLLRAEKVAASRMRVVVGTVLTPQQQLVLQVHRPEFHLEFRPNRKLQHSMAATMRLLDKRWQQSYIPVGSSVLEVGAFPSGVIMEGLENWRVSAPMIDRRDGPRAGAYDAFVRSVMSGHHKLHARSKAVFDKYTSEPDKWFFRKRAEQITGVQVDWLFLQHSAYDISMENLALMMHNTGAKGAYGSLVGNLDCLTMERGTIRPLDCEFYREGDRIIFGFKGDASFMYEHDFREYSRYFRDQHLVHRYIDSDGNESMDVFSYRVMSNHAGTIYYNVMRVSNTLAYGSLPDYEFVNMRRAEWLLVEGVWINSHATSSRNKIKLSYYVPQDTFDRLRDKVKADPRVQFSDMISYARSQDVRFVINGKSVKGTHRIPQEVFEHAVLVAWVLTQYEVKMRLGAINDVTTLMHSLRGGRKRSFFSLESEFWSTICAGVKRYCGALREYMIGFLDVDDMIPVVIDGTDIQKVDYTRVPVAPPLKSEPNPYTPVVEPLDVEIGFSRSEELAKLRALLLILEDEDQLADVRDALAALEAEEEGQQSGDVTGSDAGLIESTENEADEVVVDSSSSSATPSVHSLASTPSLAPQTPDTDVEPHFWDDLLAEYEEPVGAFRSVMDSSIPVGEAAADHLDPELECSGVVVESEALAAVDEYVDINRALHKKKLAMATYYRNNTIKYDGNPCAVKCAHTRVLRDDGTIEKFSGNSLNIQYFRVRGSEVVALLRPRGLKPSDVSYVLDHNTGNKAKVISDRDRHLVHVPDGWYFTYAEFAIENALELASSAASVAANRFDFSIPASIVANYGVPGCGKTWAICQRVHSAMRDQDYDFMILVAASSTCADTLSRLSREYGDDGPLRSILTARVRTLDSYLIHRGGKRAAVVVNKLWIDEALMAHAGQVYAILADLKPRVVEVFGDKQQVPYVNFAETSVPMRHGNNLRVDRESWTYESVRLPVLACAAVAHLYDGKIRVREVAGRPIVFGEMSVHHVSSAVQVPKPTSPNPEVVLVLTFSQMDKDLLIKRGYCLNHKADRDHKRVCQVRTIVEAQGADTQEVIAYRSEPRALRGIYAEPQRVNVLLTRHKRKFSYYTHNASDMASLWIRHANANVELQRRVQGEYDEVVRGVVRYNALMPYVENTYADMAAIARTTYQF